MNNGNLSVEENAFLYALNECKAAVYEQVITFNDNIDKEKLIIALRETIKYFDRFRMKAVINKDGKVELIENDTELPVFDDIGQIYTLGTKDTNYYLYAVAIKGAKLRITYFHVLCDGRGAAYFINTLLLQYITIVYNENDAKNLIIKLELDDSSHKMNYNDAILPYVETNMKNEISNPLSYDTNKNVFIVDKEVESFYKNYYYSTSIEWDMKSLINTVHKYNTTPFVFFFMLIADSMIESFDVKNGSIITNMAVDLREFFSVESFYNFASSVNVEYKCEWYNLTIEEKIAHIKEFYNDALNYKNIVLDIYKVEQMMKKVSVIQNVDWLSKQRKENFGKINMPLFTCFISNLGKTSFAEVIKRHIKDCDVFSTPFNIVPDYIIFSKSDTGMLIQNQNFKNERIMKNVFERLESFGIKSKFFNEKKIELSHFDTLKLEKI